MFSFLIKKRHYYILKNASFKMPNDIKKGENIHLILKVKDKELSQITRYQRVIIKLKSQ